MQNETKGRHLERGVGSFNYFSLLLKASRLTKWEFEYIIPKILRQTRNVVFKPLGEDFHLSGDPNPRGYIF